MSQEMLYFDEQTNTAYFQLQIQGNELDFEDVMNLVLTDIMFESHAKELEFPIAMADIGGADLIANPHFTEESNWQPAYILAPSMGEDFPEVPGNSWISNVAIIDGKLHMQIASPIIREQVHGDNIIGMLNVMLTDADGEWAHVASQAWLEVNENFQIVSIDEMNEMSLRIREGEISEDEWTEWFENNFKYVLNEMVFEIDTDNLENYNLSLMASVSSSVAGDWSMTVYTNGGSDSIRVMSGEPLLSGNALLEYVTVSPLGVSFGGSEIIPTDRAELEAVRGFGANAFMSQPVLLETSEGRHPVSEWTSGGGSAEFDEDGNVIRATFNGFARAETPIDVAEVIAVIIGDVRIELE